MKQVAQTFLTGHNRDRVMSNEINSESDPGQPMKLITIVQKKEKTHMKAIVLAKPDNLGGTHMKAIVCTHYGPPDVLKLEAIQKPTPGDDEILVEVHAASVNYSNLILVRGKPFLARLGFGLLKPKLKIPGSDIAGRVEAVGRNAKQLRPGDEVFGDLSNCGRGGYAEYVCVPETGQHIV